MHLTSVYSDVFSGAYTKINKHRVGPRDDYVHYHPKLHVMVINSMMSNSHHIDANVYPDTNFYPHQTGVMGHVKFHLIVAVTTSRAVTTSAMSHKDYRQAEAQKPRSSLPG